MAGGAGRKRLYLIDGHNYLYRAFHAIRSLSNSKGFPTNAVYGFVTMLLRVFREENPDYAAVAFDSRGPPPGTPSTRTTRPPVPRSPRR